MCFWKGLFTNSVLDYRSVLTHIRLIPLQSLVSQITPLPLEISFPLSTRYCFPDMLNHYWKCNLIWKGEKCYQYVFFHYFLYCGIAGVNINCNVALKIVDPPTLTWICGPHCVIWVKMFDVDFSALDHFYSLKIYLLIMISNPLLSNAHKVHCGLVLWILLMHRRLHECSVTEESIGTPNWPYLISHFLDSFPYAFDIETWYYYWCDYYYENNNSIKKK